MLELDLAYALTGLSIDHEQEAAWRLVLGRRTLVAQEEDAVAITVICDLLPAAWCPALPFSRCR